MKRWFIIAVGVVFLSIRFFSVQAGDTSPPVLRIDPGGHMSVVWKVLFSRDGRYVISAGEDKTVRLWEVNSGRLSRYLLGEIGPGQEGKIFSIALSPDNSLLAVGGYFPQQSHGSADIGLIRLYDFNTGEIKAVLRGHNSVVTALSFSPDGTRLASGAGDREIKIWRIDPQPLPVRTLTGHTDIVSAVGFSSDGERLFSASYDGSLKLWNTNTGELLQTMTGHEGQIWAADYSPDGRYIVSAGYQDRMLKLWDGQDGRFVKDLARLEQGPPGLAFNSDGTKVVLGAQEGDGDFACPVYAIPSGEMVARFQGHDNSVKAVAVSPDGKLAASAGGSGNEVLVWNLETGETIKKMAGVGAPVWSVGISPDNAAIVWGNRVENSTWEKLGPWEHLIALKQGDEWGLSLGPVVKDQNAYIGAVHGVGPYTLAVKQGGPYNWPTVLEVYREGAKRHEIVRNEYDGAMHRSFTFTPDGKAIISGGNNGVLTAYDTDSGRALTQFIGHESEVWAVAVSADGRFLLSGANDQTIRLWPLENLGDRPETEPLIGLFIGSDREWIAWAPNGYYVSSLRGDRYVGWHVNRGPDRAAEFFPAERFVKTYYRPDVIEAILSTGDVDRGMEAASKSAPMEATAELERILPPAIRLLEPASRFIETPEDHIAIKAVVKSMNQEPITKIQILIDGRPEMTRQLAFSEEEKNHEVILEREIALRPGENNLTLIASNARAASNPQTITVVRKSAEPAEKMAERNLYVLAVGVSEYRNPEIDLNLADDDARAVADYFTNNGGPLYEKIEVRMLVNEEATRDKILEGLDWLTTEAGERDVALLFLAGHGVNDKEGSYYFMPHDVEIKRMRATGVEWFRFQEILTGSPSTIILMADTCHSGSITGKRRTAKEVDMTRALKLLVASGSGVVVMTASTGSETSQEDPAWGHGAFTKALLDGLTGQADYDRNGLIDLKEIDLFVSHRVMALTEERQHPTTEIPATLPNFPLAAPKR